MEKSHEIASVTSAELHRQDTFWEDIISKYQRTIQQLRKNEQEVEERLCRCKIMMQALITFNLLKLSNKANCGHHLKRLIRLACNCKPIVTLAVPIAHSESTSSLRNIFKMKETDLIYMATIKDLVTSERQLLHEVNKLRVKDAALIETKRKVDTFMAHIEPLNVSDEITDLPLQVIPNMGKLRDLESALNDLKKENQKAAETLTETLPKQLSRLQVKNRTLKQDYQRLSEETCNPRIQSGLKHTLKRETRIRDDLRKIVASLEEQVNILRSVTCDDSIQ